MAGFLLTLALLADGGGKVAFQKDYEAARTQARERGVPVLLYFWCDWSPYCLDLDKGALSDDAVVEAARGFVPVIVDVSRDTARLREKFRVRFAPAILFVGADGRVLDDHKDTWQTERVLKSLRAASRRWGRAFWAGSLKEALEAGKKEGRLVVVRIPPRDDPSRPEKFLRDSLGDLAWKFLFAMGEPADSAAWKILDPADSSVLAELAGEVEAGEFRAKAAETLKSWKKK